MTEATLTPEFREAENCSAIWDGGESSLGDGAAVSTMFSPNNDAAVGVIEEVEEVFCDPNNEGAPEAFGAGVGEVVTRGPNNDGTAGLSRTGVENVTFCVDLATKKLVDSLSTSENDRLAFDLDGTLAKADKVGTNTCNTLATEKTT